MKIGKKLQYLLKISNNTNTKLSNYLNCHRAMITTWIKCIQNPPKKYQKSIAEFFKISETRLMNDDDFFDVYMKHQLIKRNINIEQKNLQIADFLDDEGKIYYTRGEEKEALFCFNLSKDIIKEILGENHILYAKSLSNICLCLSNPDFLKKISYLFKALHIYIKNNINECIPLMYNNLGLAYKEKNLTDIALYFYNKGLEERLEKKQENHIETGRLYNNIGMTYLQTADLKKALQYLKKALSIWKLFYPEGKNSCFLFLNIGNTYFKMEKYKKALQNYFESLTMYEYLENKYQISTLYNNIGSTYFKMQLYQKSYQYHLKCLNLTEKLYGPDHAYFHDSQKKLDEVSKFVFQEEIMKTK